MDEIDKAAFQLYQTYSLAQGVIPFDHFEALTTKQRIGWRAVAQRFADALGRYIIIYGYNGTEPYDSELDKLISEGRK